MSPSVRDQIEGNPPTEDIEPPDSALLPADDQPEQEGEQPEGWLAVLQADTPKDQIHQRPALAKGGQPVMINGQPLILDYVTARFVQDRLDAAVGPQNWATQFENLPNTDAVRAGIGIRVPGTEEWVWKWDVGVPSSIEPQKGAHSDAFKRAAVQWGIARDLYDDRDEKAVNVMVPQEPMTQQVAQAQPVAYPMGAPGSIPPQQGYDQQVSQMPQPGTAPWACPIHEDVKVVPGGISKRTGRPYRAFYACPVAGCDSKGPSV